MQNDETSSIQYIETGDKYLMDTYARYPILAYKGKNARLWDKDGKEYIDFGSGVGVNALGFCDPEWSAAVGVQATMLNHCSNYYYNLPNITLAQKLTTLTGMERVFFANSGAEANEGAIKLARKYSSDKYGPNRCNIITLNNSFHGRTVTTLDATGQPEFHNHFSPFTGGFKYCDTTIESLVSSCDSTVCAIMMEAIQGEGGVVPLDKNFVTKVCDFAKQKDILIIFDEVQTGIGRTGKKFAYEHFDIIPDIVTTAKGLGGGLPIGVFMCTKPLASVLGKGHHGSTFGGNPICCAGGNVVIDRVFNDSFLASVTEKGEYIKNEILAMKSPIVKDVRGFGLMIGVVISGVPPKEISKKLVEKGLLALTAGKDVIRFLPPLTITIKDICEGLAIFNSVLEEYKNA